MFELKDKVEDIVEDIEEMAQSYYRLTVVKMADKGSKLGAALVIIFLLFGLFLFTMLFVCLGLSWWIGQQLNNQVQGFLIVAGGLLIIFLLIVLLQKKIIKSIRDLIINKIYG